MDRSPPASGMRLCVTLSFIKTKSVHGSHHMCVDTLPKAVPVFFYIAEMIMYFVKPIKRRVLIRNKRINRLKHFMF